MFGIERRKRSVTILGSCVSRDIFEYISKELFEIEHYYARTKIVSQLSSPIFVCDEEIDLKSNFQKRLVLNDLLKSQFDSFDNSVCCIRGGYCVIDFIDERFNLIRYNNTFVTKSNELVNSKWLEGKKYEEMQYRFVEGIWKLDDENLENYIKKYLDCVLKKFSSRKIILHKAYLKDSYLKADGERVSFNKAHLDNNKRINEMLNFLYNYTEKYIPRMKVIDICKRYDADEKHKWGLAPMHYQEEYYLEAAELVKKYMRL